MVNSFWKFLPNRFSTQSFSVLKLNMLKWERKTNKQKKDQSYREWRGIVILTIKILNFKTLMECKNKREIHSTSSYKNKNSKIPSRIDADGIS